MHSNMFINLPVADLQKSIEFFTKVGYTFNPQFTDETSTCMVLGPNLFAMLLNHDRFKGFAPAPIGDSHATSSALISLSVDSREEVDALIARAVAAGGTTYREVDDYGFMRSWGYRDLDGQVWEVFWMDPSHVQG